VIDPNGTVSVKVTPDMARILEGAYYVIPARPGEESAPPVLVRVTAELVEYLAREDSEPVVIVGLDRQDDGTYDMVLRSVAKGDGGW
jgi:hypothetical protein